MTDRPRRWWPFARHLDPPSDAAAEEAPPATEASAAGQPSELACALDLLVQMLRLIGEVPVLTDHPEMAMVRSTCEAWADHLLTQAPPPAEPHQASRRQRAWRGLAQFVTARRHREQELVAGSQAQLRQAILTLTEAVRGTVARDHSDTAALEELVDRLRLAAARESQLEGLRQAVQHTGDHLLRLAAQRDARQQVIAEYATRLSEQVQRPTTTP